MQRNITLIYTDRNGDTRQRVMISPRLTIGSDEDNDWRPDAPGIRPHHAQIDDYDGVVRIYPSSSDVGILVNQIPVKSFATLANDDVIWLGPHFKIAIRIEPAGRGIPNQKARSHQPRPRKFAAARARAGHGSWRRTLNAPVLACAFIVIVLIVAIVAAKLNGNGKSDSRPRGNQSPDHSIILSPTPDDKTPAPEDCVKKAAISAMTRLGNEKSGREYSFANPGAIEEIRSLVSSHQNSPALARAIEAIRSDTKVLANFSQKGINPSLLAYAALAET